jgi:integrase
LIQRARNYRGKETRGKIKNAVREIVLHTIVREIIERQIQKAKCVESDYIFCNRIGEPRTQKGANQTWRRIAAERDLPGTPYSLRHTFISMVKNDLPEQMIKAIVGHSVSMDTFGVYGHKVDGEMKEAAKIMNITFGRKLS